jgi:hypothetical protein
LSFRNKETNMKRAAIILMLLVASAAMAQTQSAPPAPVAGSVQDQPATPTYEPMDQPLSGVESQDIGWSSESRNTFVPFVTASGGWESNAPRLPGTTSTNTGSGITNLAGGLTLNRQSGTGNVTSLEYMGGGQLYTLDSNLDGQFQRLNFSQRFLAGRWLFLLSDGFSYQKDAFASSPPMLFPGVYFGPGGTYYRPGVTPGESIIGQNSPRINNSSTGQVTYGFSRATSLTTNFSYGVLHYLDSTAYLSNRQMGAGAGLDHRFGRDTLGVNYNLTRFSYDDIPVKFDSHTTQLVYSHVLSGRWSFQAGGGPAVVVSDYSLYKMTHVYGSGQVALHYKVPMTDLTLRYGRSVTNGSGVLPGAITDDVGFTGTRGLSRATSVNFSGGYSRNSGVFLNSSFNTLYVGAGISQTLGRYASVSFGYTGQRQTGNAYSGLTRHAVLVSFKWSFRPIMLR